MKKKKKDREKSIPDSFEQASKYGTYEVQENADTQNEYPEIGQKE